MKTKYEGVTRAERTAVSLMVATNSISYLCWALYVIWCFGRLFPHMRLAQATNGILELVQFFVVPVFFLLLFIGFVMALIKPLRILGGSVLGLAARLGLFNLTCWSATIAYTVFGAGGLIFGSLLAGYGIIAAALLGILVRSEWAVLGHFLMQFLIVAVPLALGFAIITAHSNNRDGEAVQSNHEQSRADQTD